MDVFERPVEEAEAGMGNGDMDALGRSEEEISFVAEGDARNGGSSDLDRIHICNIPKFFGFKQFKKLLEKHLQGISVGKIRQMKFDAYVTFKSPEDAQLAISKLDGLEVKKTVLKVALAQADEKKNREPQATSDRPFAPKTARESVTKLADMPYNEQLSQKTRTSSKLCERLLSEMRKASVHDVGQLASSKLLRKLCVGFVCGRFAQNEHHVISIADVDNITEMTKKIVEAVTDFVEKSGLPPFDEFARKGVWKMLTVREFGGDVMLIITVNPLKDQTEEEELKRKFCSR
ncbi:unnamed protein product [Heligmosomoides polygyrus]|uniref:RRM domain-containing protein n=1 Tax=Heligmosomoides polygyrus TaxID=6339 RepID=A0A183GII4_HELPZ|nr:unnamed protein product [Heligmosomoides polygyrus]